MKNNILHTAHLDAIHLYIDMNNGGQEEVNAATSCASITKEYAEKFAEWIRYNTVAEGTPKLYHRKSKKYLTTSELWDIFLADLENKKYL